MHHYYAHGLRLASQIEVRDFEVAEIDSTGRADLTISLGHVPLDSERNSDNWIHLSADRRSITLEVEGCANFQVSDGASITVDKFENHPSFGESRLRAYLLGRVLGAALYQRNMTPLHGSAVRIGKGAIVFVGERGAGKSTLCYHFKKCGYHLFADDVTCYSVADNAATIVPGIRRNKLWRDTLHWYQIETSGLEPVEEQSGKFHIYHRLDPLGSSPVPLHAVIELAPFGTETNPRLSTVPALEAIQLLHTHNYLPELIPALGLNQMFLDCAVQIVFRVPVMRLHRPRSLAALDETIRMILCACQD
jgi:hypothetical protein